MVGQKRTLLLAITLIAVALVVEIAGQDPHPNGTVRKNLLLSFKNILALQTI
jgi:hypothetical protein